MSDQPKRRRWLWFGLAGAGVAGTVVAMRRGRSTAQPPALPATLESRALDTEVWADLLGTDTEVRQAAVALVRARREAEPYATALLKVVADANAFTLLQRRAAGEALDYLGDPRVKTREPEMISIPGGAFKMGTPESDAPAIIEEYKHAHVIPRFLAKEAPQRSVQVDEFEIAKYPVTNREFAEFVQATGHRKPAAWDGPSYADGKGNHPVARIEHEDAVAYVKWLAKETGQPFRLPTEAEWEKAARGTDGRVYPWGNQFDPDRCNTLEGHTFAMLYKRARPLYNVVMRVGAFVVDNGLIGDNFDKVLATTPVGIYPNGASPYGVLDMGGNAEEWVADKFALYPGYPYGDEYDWSAESWVCRGGAWNRPGDVARVARRHGNFVGTGSIGLRLARDVK
jgi:formylglycine-generating enzyme required for sulfatase activity